jgi:hypothetical protein
MLTYFQPASPENGESNEAKKQVLVHCYYQDRNTFLVTEVIKDTKDDSSPLPLSARRFSSAKIVPLNNKAPQWIYREVPPDQLACSAPSAKFYPVLESLMFRAEQAAAATSQLLLSKTAKRLVDSTGKAIQEGVAQISTIRNENLVSGPRSLEDLATTIEKAAPDIEDNIKQVMTMVKDEEITVLLEKCKGRLEQLASTDLPSATRRALEKTGIHIQLEGDDSSLTQSMEASRKAALTALQQLLQQAELDDLDKVRGDLTQNFTIAFDSLSKAAKSDRGLNEMFESFAEKTTSWQEATGRLMTTRSASIFLEGATRIQARAAAIFGNGQFQAVGEIGSKLTKSFTEGDAALARLKSVELGEAVKFRLVEAIEVRSESIGGLDGIIAGALTTVKSSGGPGNRIQDILKNLQRNASSATVDAHETLIAILSSHSTYRDEALLRLEQVLCDLGNHIGDDLAPDEIAAIVRGEGGTAKIFEPIARRAMLQIEKQLDAAESQVKDATVLEVLTRVRKIMSGELTLTAIMDDIVNVLNDDKVVAAGESIVQRSEQVLDAIEGVSANQAVADAIQIAEKAGITKETVMREFEKLNVDDLLGVAEQAVTDEKARRRLLSSATDTALDFALRILPSMPVPPFEGVKDGLVYFISNLSMKGFKVKKEDIQIELAGMRATKQRKGSKMRDVPTPDNRDEAIPVIRKSHSADSSFSSASSEMDFDEIHSSVKATELLIIDIRNTSAALDNAVWNFEQTYLPYLKGGGIANVKMSGGSIRLQFELRKRRKEKTEGADCPEWEPVLCLHDRSCTISEVDLSLQGEGKITWILNKLAAIFKGPLRDYVVSTIVSVLSNRSGWILERLNKVLSPYWDLILRTAQLQMVSIDVVTSSHLHYLGHIDVLTINSSSCILKDELVEADEDVIVSEVQSADIAFVELLWRERLPLGMNLLMNDDSGVLKVVDFPRGSQARSVCEKRGFDPDAFKGASIVAVNGSHYEDQDEFFNALKDPGRPKTVRFRLAETEEAERLRKFLEGENAPIVVEDIPREFRFRKVHFKDAGELGIEFGSAVDNAGLVVSGFVEGDGGIVSAAERSGVVIIGDLLTHINDELVVGLDGDARSRAIHLLEAVASIRPLSLTFVNPYMHRVVIEKPSPAPGVDSSGGPEELIYGETHEGDKRRVVVKGFKNVSGRAEGSGLLIGDQLVFVNGLPVGAGCRWLGTPSAPTIEEVFDMLKNEAFYPIGLTFARPRPRETSRWTATSREFSDSEAETICVTAESQERLGCLLDQVNKTDVVVTDFEPVAGVFQRAMAICKDDHGNICLSFDSINGQFVPSYATVEIVRNALNRSWKTGQSVELVLCDDELKKWLLSKLK